MARAAGQMAITEIAPSGVNALPALEQIGVFGLCFVAIGIGAVAILLALGALSRALPSGWFARWQGSWPLLGMIYMAAGLTHFTYHGAYESIYPPQGTWGGLWQLPGSAEFHVAWTGVAELLGGAGLVGGALAETLEVVQLRWLKPTAAACLFALTLCVTPANIYMYTHGAMMEGLPGIEGAVPVVGHYIRATLQSVLLALLAGMAREGAGDKGAEEG
jgi:uncharacterized membrane protein